MTKGPAMTGPTTKDDLVAVRRMQELMEAGRDRPGTGGYWARRRSRSRSRGRFWCPWPTERALPDRSPVHSARLRRRRRHGVINEALQKGPQAGEAG